MVCKLRNENTTALTSINASASLYIRLLNYKRLVCIKSISMIFLHEEEMVTKTLQWKMQLLLLLLHWPAYDIRLLNSYKIFITKHLNDLG